MTLSMSAMQCQHELCSQFVGPKFPSLSLHSWAPYSTPALDTLDTLCGATRHKNSISHGSHQLPRATPEQLHPQRASAQRGDIVEI